MIFNWVDTISTYICNILTWAAGAEPRGCCWQIHWLDRSDCRNVTMSIRSCCFGGCFWQLHPTEDNINKVITGMSPCPTVVVVSADEAVTNFRRYNNTCRAWWHFSNHSKLINVSVNNIRCVQHRQFALIYYTYM